ncbi:MAG TPA: hypothetical protein VFF50_06420, partial [Candidatus Deferrimicrobiaceae bacterium]|nr:hypothetical protein [Candidatus Deferrimicrobiaceae bacterium]
MEQQRSRKAVTGRKLLPPAHPLSFERRTVFRGKYAAFGLLTVLAIFGAGCTVGPRYARPVTTIEPFH